MATIKSYSDLKQSKVLSKILSDDSADMVYIASANDDIGDTLYTAEIKSEIIIKEGDTDYINCWSLAALLSVLPLHLIVNNQRYAFSMIKGLDKNGETYAIKYAIFNTTFYFHLTDAYDNPVDACYWMILKLNELKML
jgi:hypothetical protein